MVNTRGASELMQVTDSNGAAEISRNVTVGGKPRCRIAWLSNGGGGNPASWAEEILADGSFQGIIGVARG